VRAGLAKGASPTVAGDVFLAGVGDADADLFNLEPVFDEARIAPAA
jgi:hypothetical protein